MFEPTETESKESLDTAVEVLRTLYKEAASNAEKLLNSPHTTPIYRVDEVGADRNPRIRYEFK